MTRNSTVKYFQPWDAALPIPHLFTPAQIKLFGEARGNQFIYSPGKSLFVTCTHNPHLQGGAGKIGGRHTLLNWHDNIRSEELAQYWADRHTQQTFPDILGMQEVGCSEVAFPFLSQLASYQALHGEYAPGIQGFVKPIKAFNEKLGTWVESPKISNKIIRRLVGGNLDGSTDLNADSFPLSRWEMFCDQMLLALYKKIFKDPFVTSGLLLFSKSPMEGNYTSYQQLYEIFLRTLKNTGTNPASFFGITDESQAKLFNAIDLKRNFATAFFGNGVQVAANNFRKYSRS